MGRSSGKNKLSKNNSPRPFSLVSTKQRKELDKRFFESNLYKLDQSAEISSNHGVYGIFYVNPSQDYKKLINDPKEDPIYIGKAGSAGLSSRLSQHHKSIEAVGMDPKDFRCRFLELESEYDAFAAEIILQEIHKPLWNTILKGFGNKNVGRARLNQVRSRWDTFHDGRNWASEMSARKEDSKRLEKEMLLFANFKKETLIENKKSFTKDDWLKLLKDQEDKL